MKLIGSRTESIKRDNLLESEAFINKNEKIIGFLIEKYGDIKSAYVLTHTPEQGEDIFIVLINGNFIVGFELSRIDNEISDIYDMPVVEYSKQLTGKLAKLDLAIALDLANNHQL